MRVTHTQYGEGTVVSTNGDYSVVNFDNVGQKTVATNSLKQMLFG